MLSQKLKPPDEILAVFLNGILHGNTWILSIFKSDAGRGGLRGGLMWVLQRFKV